MRRHPPAPANVAGSVATFGTDFTAPEAVCWLLSWQELQLLCLGADLFHQGNRRSSLMLFPLRNTRCVPCLEQHLRLHTRRYSGQCSKNWDGGSSVFYINAFEPGGPQRENACGLFIPGIVHAACKMKRARPASRPGFRIRIFFEDAEANLRLLRAVGVQLKIVVSFRGCVANVTRDGAARARPTARTGRGQAWASNP